MNIYKTVIIICLVATTSCTWRDCARNTAYAIGSTAILITGNSDAYGFNENYGGQLAEGLVDTLFDAANATD
ncbi:MAG: hypothetical protein KUA37_07135 [Desulfomicrobium sp.]|nr:hypothetical protein [Pseudomonadota bacterium]MBV1711765.1 hypothetical protein [Desulfomicrobium sp.]MBU4572647.1 hypothetical protein [Pseudomonadota bacterium]MBU4593572.1 hypothetical protein [Pseudomonadota bacterium]MBV1719173.1 hypothetical protein [Desulfomicrobium sp.]